MVRELIVRKFIFDFGTRHGILKGTMLRYFESFSATYKITSNLKETAKYLFSKIAKPKNWKNTAKKNVDG